MMRFLLTLISLLALFAAGCSDDTPTVDSDSGAPDSDVDATASYDGAWEDAFEIGDEGTLLNVWGTGADDVYTVGGQPELGIAYHWDGSEWEALTIPDGPWLFWVYGVDDEVFIVGDDGRALHRVADGDFVETTTPTDVQLWGVWGPSADQIYAVGGDAANPDGEPVLIEWNGSEWSAIELPDLDREIRALFKIWGTGPNDVFAVGQSGVIIHFDGTEWTQQRAGTTEDVISLWGTGPDDIVAVGGRANGLVARWDGERWESQELVGVQGLNGVWVDNDGTAHIVGNQGTIIRVAAGGFDFVEEDYVSRLVIHGVWGVHGGTRWAVGGSLDLPPPYEGVALVDP